ncbi:methyltransferase domain-containing protein [Pseudonocardia hydrocarbonoxydans]|uniref:methyltransferase domain-containing protein n=1 Tax=Pseudonocardia hydrocarbonoxydans TaxID=76726 RepID=UPI0031CE92C1
MFDPDRGDLAGPRDRLLSLLGEQGFADARRSTLNAHYTDAAIARAMWASVVELGFTGGRVLEPGCGAGTFIGFAPPGAEMVGVEQDPTTATIAAALYPDAKIRTESFADTPFPDGSFDLAIGNVPFGRLPLHDARHNRSGHTIHNHFLIKSLHLVRPGGLVVAITSRYTLDARNPAARRELAELADLVGAIRLPSDAHQRAAGTTVVTDLLLLRRREPGRPGNGEWWEQVKPLDVERAPVTGAHDAAGTVLAPDGVVEVNRWFHDHPDMVLGTMRLGRGAHREDELMVLSGRPITVTLSTALDSVTARARTAGLVLTPPPTDARTARKQDDEALLVGREGLIETTDDGGFTRVVNGVRIPHRVPASQAMELRALLGLRDTTVALLDAESTTGEDTAEIARLRAGLGQQYRAYTQRWGPIKRCTWRRTGREDPDTGEERMARVRPAQGGFRHDPFAPLVRALERYDDVTGTATPASIFIERVVAPRAPRLGADTPADALAVCLDTHGTVRLPEIAQLLGTTTDAARTALGRLVFDEPGTGGPSRLVPAAEYLSGDVRAKLVEARRAAAQDPRFAVNVTALTAVLPADLLPAEISVRLGAPWVATAYVQQFLRETLEDPRLEVEHPGGAVWAVRGNNYGVAATATWGTRRRAAPAIAEALLAQRTITVYDEFDDGTRVLNLTETVAAQEKARELDARFGEWVWEEPQRAADLARTYNDTFNSVVLRNYDDTRLSLPGVAVTFTPRPHQVAAVARMINEPAVGLFHEVGAGKTAEMVMGVMELRRLGLVRKPAIVVPNHMLEQFATEFLAIYPRANVLPAGRDDLAGDRRREFVGRVATGDWDAVILTRSAFERLPVRLETQRDYLRIGAHSRMVGADQEGFQPGEVGAQVGDVVGVVGEPPQGGVQDRSVTAVEPLAEEGQHLHQLHRIDHLDNAPGAGNRARDRARGGGAAGLTGVDRHGEQPRVADRRFVPVAGQWPPAGGARGRVLERGSVVRAGPSGRAGRGVRHICGGCLESRRFWSLGSRTLDPR